jgi:AcrR family transcriptional regulator
MPTTVEPLSARRQQILDAAERLLRRYGFAKTTIADIAREAGIGVGTFYLEFPSKDAVVGELSLQNHRRVLEAMQGAAARRGSHANKLRNVLEERLRAFARIYSEGLHGGDLVHCSCAAVREAHQRFRMEEEELLADLLDDADRAGEFAVPQHPPTVARVILRLYDLFIVAEAEGKSDGDELEVTHRLVLRGLLRR